MPDRRLRLWLLALDRFELSLRGKAGKERNAFIRKVAASYASGTELPGHLVNAHRKKVESILSAHYQKVIPYFAQTALAQIKSRRIEKKYTDALYQALLSEWAAREALRKSRLISDTDRDDVMAAITGGLEEGQGVAEIARNIRKVSQLTPVRASTIARTETHAAATFGSVESVRAAERDLGVVMMKEWLPTLDGRTRPEHAAMAGKPPIPMSEKFLVGGELMDRPGDPSASAANVIACRCALAYSEAE